MKTSLYLILFVFVSTFFSCQDESNGIGEKGVGYLTLNIGTSAATNTRAVEYNPKQIAVQIINAETGKVEEETDDWETWEGEKFALEAGKYAIVASSAGFDGSSPEFEKPYYAGSDTVDIVPNTSQTAKITCTLANVKLEVDFSFFKENDFKAASVEVGAGSSSLTFSLGSSSETKAGYFPVKPLTANLTVTNKNGAVHTLKTSIDNVKERDYIILKYKSGEEEQGSSGITVTVDESTKAYTYTIPVELKEVAAGLDATSVNAWSKFAYLEGTATVKGMELDDLQVKLQYKTLSAPGWTSLDATKENDVYKATATGLESSTEYQYRMYYKNGDTEFVSDTIAFTTEKAEELYNGSFDIWSYGTGDYAKTWFAEEASKAGLGTSIWDSGNIGTSTYMTTLVGVHNPTSPEETEIHSKGGKAAKLASQFVGFMGMGKFAAGNIYTGNYCETFANPMGARIRFGQEFTSRPTQLKGWYKYNRGTNIDEDNDATYADILKDAGGDLCSVYIALVDNEGLAADGVYPAAAFEIDNRLNADEPSNFKYKNTIDFSESNTSIIAYGELSAEEAKGTDGQWKEFTIDLKYRDLTRVPKYIIVVASASKYGDFFTGSTKSVMYIDDFELVYGDEPVVQE